MWYQSKEETYLPPVVLQRALEDPVLEECVTVLRYRAEEGDVPPGYVRLHNLTDDQLEAFAVLGDRTNNRRFAKVCRAVINYEGVIPSFEAAHAMIVRYLRAHCKTGWLYRIKDRQGVREVRPIAVSKISQHIPDYRTSSREDKPRITIVCTYAAFATERTYREALKGETSKSFEPGDVTRRKVSSLLQSEGWHMETPELRALYDADHAHVDACMSDNYSDQYRCDASDTVPGDKVLLLLQPANIAKARESFVQCPVVMDSDDGEYGGAVPVPVHVEVPIFRLGSHSFTRVHATRLTPYVYNPELVNKLILPETHMDLLDVLTSNTDAFLSDIVEGKSAGNIILCKGVPGIGKTLTAEVYSEVVQKPIYSVHSGALGTQPHEVEKSLETIFKRVAEWDCLLLLDEADVFVCERGSDLVQNAIVSVFLRTLEYFPGLMFMTTNRSDNIDDAIISRCAAIIDYGLPTRSDLAAVWRVMAEQQGYDFPDDLVASLVDAFPKATPRDVKHLLRLALRVSLAREEPLDEALFRRVAAFRAVEIAKPVSGPLRKPVPRTRKRVFLPPE